MFVQGGQRTLSHCMRMRARAVFRLRSCCVPHWLVRTLGLGRAEHLTDLASGHKYLGPFEADFLATALHIPIAIYLKTYSAWLLSSLAHPK